MRNFLRNVWNKKSPKFKKRLQPRHLFGFSWNIKYVHALFYKKSFYKKNEPQKPQNFKKILRKSVASNA